MREIKCRFRSELDILELGKRMGVHLTYRTHTCYVDYDYIEQRDPTPIIKGIPKPTEEFWVNMPEFITDYREECGAIIVFIFKDEKYTSEYLSEVFDQNISDSTKSIWYPKIVRHAYEDLRVVGGDMPKYPIYIVSKGRACNQTWHTSYRLSQSNIPHYIVVEPQEVDIYKEAFKDTYATILELDMKYQENYDVFSDLGNTNSTGPGAARNFAWEHSMSLGYAWHHVLDDNINGWRMWFRGKRVLARTGEIFRSLERIVERFSNVYIAGDNYMNFCVPSHSIPHYYLNTRIYSMLFIRNDIPYRWRGRYNEDTDLSLRVLKDGFCTFESNLFLGDKATTQRKGGGNTAEFYAEEGTSPKSQMLYDMHPDVTTLVERWGRPHHYVDYKGFTQPLLYKDIQDDEWWKVPDIRVVRIPKEIMNTEKDTREYLEAHIDEFERVDNTDLYL